MLGKGSLTVAMILSFSERERELLLSKIPGDPTVGSLRDEKKSCSTRRRLRMGTEFREFP